MKKERTERTSLEQYLYDVLGIHVSVQLHRWKERDKLPFFLTAIYDFHQMSLMEHPCLLMMAKKETISTPAEVRKHQEIVQKQWKGVTIYVPHTISSYNRKRLIEQKIPFIFPGTQLYLPDLHMDLREKYPKRCASTVKTLSPATQAVIIHTLLLGIKPHMTPAQLAHALGYSSMTMTRAFDELEKFHIGTTKQQGKERWWEFKEGKRDLWSRAEPFMKTPIKKICSTYRKPMAIAGLSALAEYSMLNPPIRATYAIGVEQWKKWTQEGVIECDATDVSGVEVEVWNYDPNLFISKTLNKPYCVDPFSLYLSLKSNTDERIEQALSEMLESITW